MQITTKMELEVLSSAKIDEPIVIDYPMTVNLNGKTISTTSAIKSAPAFRILSDVKVAGEGKIDARPGESCYAFIVGNSTTGGNLTIENGTFYGDTSAVSVTMGMLTIEDGKFAVNPYQVEGQEDNYNFLLNCIDANYKDDTANIVVKGGTFYKFNPADNAAEGANTNFCAAGCIAEGLNDYFTVRATNYVAQVGETKYEDINDAIAAAKEAGTAVTVLKTIVLDKDGEFDMKGVCLNAANSIQNAPVIRVLADVTIVNPGIIDGRGPVAGEGGINCYAFIVGNNEKAGELTITDGIYRGVTSAISITNGTVNISGGTFQTGHDNEGTDYGTTYLLNCVDAAYKNGTAKYNITGGKFVGFNPENNAAEGEGTNFLSEGYKASDYYGDNKWYVAEANVVMDDDKYFATIKDALATLTSADTTVHKVKVLNDLEINVNYSTYNYPILVNGFAIELDLNGKTLTADWSKYEGIRKDNALIGVCNGGKLDIIDSVGGGKIVNNDDKANVENRIFWIMTSTATKELVVNIKDGTFVQNDQNVALLYVQGNKPSDNLAPMYVNITGGHFETVNDDFFNAYDGYQHESYITGGTFNKNPTDGEIKIHPEYTAVENADGTWGVVEKSYVAQVGEVKYVSLKEAIEACTNGETVKLIADITYDADDVVYAHGGATGFGKHDQYNPSIVYIGGTKGATDAENQPSNVNAVLDLNGHTITNNADAYLFMIMDNAKLTFTDSVGGGEVKSTTSSPVIWVTGTDTLVTIQDGKYSTANAEGLMWATHSGDLNIGGGDFSTTAGDASLLIIRNAQDRQNSKYFISGKSSVTVTGGTFHGFNPEKMLDDSTDPFTEFNAVPEGYAAVKYGEDIWTVGVKTNVTIGSVEDLMAFANAVTGNKEYQGVKVAANPDAVVTLTADLDLTDSGFVGIGNGAANAFSGTFDGQNHTISNMTMSCNYYRGVGFFRSLDNGAEVKNVTFENANIDNGAATAANHFYGVVAGFSNNLTLDNVDVKDSSVTCKYAGAAMVGCLEGATTIKNCDIENFTLKTTNIRAAVYGILGNSETGHTAELENNTITNAVSVINGEVKALKETLKYNEWAAGTEYTESTYVAQIGETKYSTLYDAVAAAAEGDTITLIGDVVRAETLVVNKKVTIDLNGNTVSAYQTLSGKPVFRILADVTVKGGTVDGTTGINSYAFIVGNSETAGILNIADGTYKGVTSAVSITKGAANISGGVFSTAHDGEGTDYGAKYLLNCMDDAYKAGTAKYIITGGSFVGFNPEKNAAEGEGTNFLTAPYTASEEADNVYTVVNYILWIKEQLLAGKDVTLDRDIVVDGSMIESIPASTNGNGKYPNYGIFNVVGDYDVTFDLNGHTITYNGHASFEWNGKTYNSCTVAHGLFFANAGADLTIKDSKGTSDVTVYGLASGAYVASPDTKITIEGGTWKNEGCKTCGGTNLFLYPLQGGELYIKGGHFEQVLDSNGESYLIVEHGGEYANSVIDYGKTKVEISGGTFVGMNPEEAQYFQQTADNKLVMGATTNAVAEGFCAVETSKNVWEIENAVAMIVETGRGYTTVGDALSAAKSNETVKMLKNSEEQGYLLVKPGVTLDLNGQELTAMAVAAPFTGGKVIDSDGAGKVIVEAGNLKLQKDNGQLPIWSEENGYYSFTTIKFVQAITNVTEDSTKFNFRPTPWKAEEARAIFMDGAADEKLSLVARLTWTKADGSAASLDVKYTEDYIIEAANAEGGKMFTITVSGIAEINNLKVQAVFISDTGAETCSEPTDAKTATAR